jgi:competence protein ComEC
MNDRILFRPLIPLLISLVGGILLGSRFAGFATGAGVLALVWAGFSLIGLYRRKPGFFMPLLLFVSLGYLSIQPWLSPRLPAHHITHYTDSHRWEIFGQIANQPQHIKNRARFDLRVASLDADHQTHAVAGLLRVTVRGDLPEIAVGDIIRFKSRMRSIRNFKNPGGFDYKRYMAFRGIYATAYVRGDRIRIVEKSPSALVFQIINRVRGTFADLVEKSGTSEVQGVLKALIIGDRTRISDATRQRFNRAGVGHLLAISGLHIGIVATVAFTFFHWLMGWIKPFLWRAWTRKTAALLSLLPVIAYGVVAGLSPSTQRAVLMVAVFLMAFILAKEQDSLNTLALAALVILVVDPPSLFSISFQLSFVTVGVIIFGFSSIRNYAVLKIAPSQSTWYQRLSVRLVSFLLVSLFAICGSLPLVAFYFNQISLVGLAANFLVVPLVGFITIPLALTALFLSPLSLTLAAWCLKAGALSLARALDIVNFFAQLPFAAIKTVTPSVLEMTCFYILGWALLTILRHRPDRVPGLQATTTAFSNRDAGIPGESVSTKTRKLKKIFRLILGDGVLGEPPIRLAKFAMILALITLTADSCYWLYQRFWHPDLRITVIDVGDGSAALLEIPGGYTIMIDGGGFSDNAAFDVGARIIAPFLWRKKIKTVDLLILSHPNSDHLNGLIYLADHFNVKTLWTNDESRDTLGFNNLMEVCARRGILSPNFAHMARSHQISGVQLDLLYPPRDFMDHKASDKWRNANNNSLVVKVSYGDASFLFPGDIMAPAERELVGLAGGRLASRVLIAPHHGSRSSSTQQLLKQVDPEVIVVSCRRNGRFNFPHPEILKRYKDLGVKILRTDLNGAVRLSTNGQLIRINSFTPNPDIPGTDRKN